MPTYHNLSSSNLVQNWDAGTITANDTWPDISIVGYLGDIDAGSPTNVDPTSLRSPTLGAIDVVANTVNANPTSGGVIEVTVGDNTMVGLNGSGTADAPSLVLYLDSSGREQVTLAFDAIDTDTSADNAAQQLNIQYRTSATSDWINVPNGYFADVSVQNAGQTTAISVTLPEGASNSATLEVRIMTTNAGGNDEFIGIDNIVVASQAGTGGGTQPGTLSIGDVIVTEGDSGTTEMNFTVTRASGSEGAVSASWSVVNGTTDASDFTGATSGTVNFADGETSATITIQVTGDLAVEPNEAFTVTLTDPQGGVTITDGSGAGTITTDDLPPIANVWINEFHYDPSSVPETGEFIEIAGQAGVDLTGYRIVLYNGSNGQPYAPTGGSINGISLSGTLGNTANGFGFSSVLSPGLQNGAPDAIALVDSYGRVVQFLSYEGALTANGGPAAGMTSTDIGRFEDQSTPGTSLQLSGTGSAYADFTWTFGNASTSGGANDGQSFLSGTDQGQIRIDNASVVEGDSGQTMLVFTLHRSGGFATAASVDYSIGFGTADAGDLPPATPLSGSVTFAIGELTQTISIPVAGDVAPEFNEWLFVELGTVTGNAVVVEGLGIGTIVNNDPLTLTIMEIQGSGHFSAFEGQPVTSSGIVTAVTATGFYMQDPGGDANTSTSDAIFVFTSSAPTVSLGDNVTVSGRVSEFGSELPLTEINITEAGFGITVNSTGNMLPASTLIGQGGLLPPTESIDSDGLTIFNPAIDGADFWEALEGMRVTIDQPQVVASSNEFGETFVVASHGQGATGLNGSGGMTISPGDYNPEIIQIDDQLLGGSGYVANHSLGDLLGDVTGILNYSFARYELMLTEVPTTTVDVTIHPETAGFAGDSSYLTVATLNVENLDPTDGRYDDIAIDIVDHLLLPDVIAIQEMQDNDGTGNGSDLSAAANAQGLIDAIFLESGVTYAYVEIAPTVANSTGGEANGNIRNGYLYRVDRVDLVEGSLQVISDPSYANSRQPLVATWEFQGQQITTINVHFYARSGGDPLWGGTQPPDISGDDRRTDQADAVGQWINDQLATDPALNIAVLGDWNGFYFEEAQTQLTGLVNLQVALLPEEERYSYLFDGNGQLLDNILVTPGLLAGAQVDGVHINAYFGATQTSDHDPQVAAFLLGPGPEDVRSDFNGDGHSDVLWRSDSGALSNWLGDANGGFVVNDPNAFTNVPTNWHVAGTGDFNGDRRDDILWRSDSGQVSSWLGQANGGFLVNDDNALSSVSTDWQIVGTGDFNGDHRDDILWRSSNGQLSDWLGQANGGFIPNDANAFTDVPTNWHVEGTGDFNGDGRDDILWRSESGEVSNWLGQANGGFANNDANAFSNAAPTSWHIVGTGDFNGDDHDDILWRSDSGQLSNWLGQANGSFVVNDANALTTVSSAWQVAGIGDYNGDGFDDILWRSDTGEVSNWLGTDTGGFVNNDANAFRSAPTDWHVQPDNLLF